MPRIQSYTYKRRFQTHGLEEFKDMSPISKPHSQVPRERK